MASGSGPAAARSGPATSGSDSAVSATTFVPFSASAGPAGVLLSLLFGKCSTLVQRFFGGAEDGDGDSYCDVFVLTRQ